MFRRLIAYCSKRYTQKNIIDIFESLRKKDITNPATVSEFQVGKLLKVLKISVANIPRYKGFDNDIDFANFSYSEFQKIPLLTKDIIRSEGDALINKSYENLKNIFKNTSGGSTGEPVQFYRTKDQAAHGVANYYYALSLNNVNIYDTSVDLWGAERDMYKTNERFNLRSFLYNNHMLNTFVLSDEIISSYIERLNKIKPKFIKAYVHSIYDISKFINKHNLKMTFKPTIHCTTGPLYPEMRTEIEHAFNDAHVYNFYGSREVSAIASETIEKNGMYVLFDNVLVEVLDDSGQPVKKGEEGNIIVTTLNNFYMPLLRYKIGDRAIKGDNLDFGVLKLDTVVGRTLGVIYKADGSKLDGQFFTSLFFNKKGIKNFQLVQKSLTELTLNIVKSDNFEEKELIDILSRVRSELPGADVDVNYCEAINLTSTGKIMYVYSELEK